MRRRAPTRRPSIGAIEEVAAVARRLIDSLETNAPPKNRDEEAARARARAAERFGTDAR